MKSITTKYIGPSNTKRSRIKATDGDNSVTLSYDDSLSSDENHRVAAKSLCNKLGRFGMYVGGHTKDGMVWVCPNEKLVFEIH